MTGNTLYYGDNLTILRRDFKNESVDLIYLDPPFNRNLSYKSLFTRKNIAKPAAQSSQASGYWVWDSAALSACLEIEAAGDSLARAMQAIRLVVDENEVLAYLVRMVPRLVELHRVLKPTGVIYLHGDPVVTPYLKIFMDAVFGPLNYRNEVIWKRVQPKSPAKVQLSRFHDVILVYAKSEKAVFHRQYRKHDPKYLERFYRFTDRGTGRRYMLDNLANPKKDRPDRTYEFPPGSGVVRVWRWTKERMMKAWEEGRVVIPEKGKVARYVRYLDEMPGVPLSDVWDDIECLHSAGEEMSGNSLQKPEALLERIIRISSNEGDQVLDPFCGSGTSLAAAEGLNRSWIGIDVNLMALTLTKNRLRDAYGNQLKYKIIGEPGSLADAQTLADNSPGQFKWWALGLVDARPYEVNETEEDILGQIHFFDDPRGKTKLIVFRVNPGTADIVDVRELRELVMRTKAEIGVLITLREPSESMLSVAARAGFYESPWGRYHRLQIITVADLLGGKRIDYPHARYVRASQKKSPKIKEKDKEQLELL
ncbi:MAG: site-specific DNA-methyltransferase [Deltaproteobacteria bacterium]|nr:site-specific DNA-methyltransferase [Deltaproteobacteria bacterium]MBW2139790.1 site-specific DNA-methyltransferase [Deltaproteobacteria bacterium]